MKQVLPIIVLETILITICLQSVWPGKKMTETSTPYEKRLAIPFSAREIRENYTRIMNIKMNHISAPTDSFVYTIHKEF